MPGFFLRGNGGNATVPDGDIGMAGIMAEPIDNRRAADHEIVHPVSYAAVSSLGKHTKASPRAFRYPVHASLRNYPGQPGRHPPGAICQAVPHWAT